MLRVRFSFGEMLKLTMANIYYVPGQARHIQANYLLIRISLWKENKILKRLRRKRPQKRNWAIWPDCDQWRFMYLECQWVLHNATGWIISAVYWNPRNPQKSSPSSSSWCCVCISGWDGATWRNQMMQGSHKAKLATALTMMVMVMRMAVMMMVVIMVTTNSTKSSMKCIKLLECAIPLHSATSQKWRMAISRKRKVRCWGKIQTNVPKMTQRAAN